MGLENENIQVVVRCRARNAKETSTKSAVVVNVQSEEGDEVLLNPSDEVGVSAQLNSKVYTFDKVFGPMADQQLVFQKVAAPLFDEFLKGYNCTLLVYGMTSTGKTYTMTGECDQNSGESLNEKAGIIPRILVKLFEVLNDTNIGELQDDYVVKCSFIELYNEELKDLLSHDPNKKLRIFDQKPATSGTTAAPLSSSQNNKSTIHIQNLEEIIIRNANHGLKTLEKGLKIRQVAATKMNDVSSRSHTIFTLNLFRKNQETGELFRISKMNLVDLAGSENISRSGALNQRAKEAGSINQSLLTLGRVINLLVEKNYQHIPYRESKLTRLLQDSLGGRTKTCLIATISPAKVNYDETLSTLEYANKAKSIQNKPQLGSSLSKDILVKELTAELSKVKADLAATKTRDGIYLDNDNYEEFMKDMQEYKTEIEENHRLLKSLKNKNNELKSQISAVESQNNEYLTIINTLNSTVDTLHNKIDKQKQNEQNLMLSSSKFKEVINVINRNLESVRNFESNTKYILSKVTDSIVLKVTNEINEALSKHNVQGSISSDVNLVKKELDNMILSLQRSTYSACKNVSESILSKFPTIFLQFESDIKQLQGTINQLESSLSTQLSKLSKENNDLKTVLNDSLFNNHTHVLDNAISQLHQQFESEAKSITSSFLEIIKRSNQNQQQLITNTIKDTVSDIVQVEKTNLEAAQMKWDNSTREILNNCDAKTLQYRKQHHDELAKILSSVQETSTFTNISKSVIDEELNNINQLTSTFQNNNNVLEYVKNIETKFNKTQGQITGLSSTLEDAKERFADVNTELTEIQNQERPNLESHDVNKIILKLEAEQSNIEKSLLPTGKTPKREILKLPNRRIDHDGSQSPPKFQLLGQRFNEGSIENKENTNTRTKRKASDQTLRAVTTRKISKLSYDRTRSPNIPKR